MKKWRWILGGVLILLVVAIVIAISLIDLDDYKDTLLVKAEDALHRKVEIGHVSMVFWPGIGVRLEQLSVGDDPKFAEDRFFAAKDLILRVRLLPLLTGRIEVVSLTLHNPLVVLVENPDGTLNVSTIGGRVGEIPEDAAEGAEIPQRGAAQVLGLLELDHLQIRDGQVKFFRRVNASSLGLMYELQDLDLVLTDLKLAETAKLEASMSVLPSGRLELEGLVGPITMDLRPETVKLAVKSGRSKVGMEGGAQPDRWVFRINAPQIHPKDLLGPLQGILPPDAEISVLSGQVELKGQTVAVSDLSFQVFKGMVKGTARMDLSAQPPPFQATVRVEGLQVGEALDAFTVHKGLLTGSAHLDLTLQGRGSDWESLARRLRGSGTVQVLDGKIPKSRFLEQVLTALEALRLGSAQPAVRRGDPLTAFSLLQGRFMMREGQIKWENLDLQAADFELRTKGITGLDKRISLDGQVSLSESLTQRVNLSGGPGLVLVRDGRLTLPVKVRGTFDRPSVNLDVKAIGKQSTDQLKKKLFDRLIR